MVEVRQEAQRRVHSLSPQPLVEINDWLSRHLALWEHRLDFRTLTQPDLDAIADQLNGRPRQTLDFKTPLQAPAEVLR